MKIRLMLIAGGLTAALNAGAELRVNEVMQSNVHGIMDDLNEFPDSWVELYNAGTADVDLSSYALSVKDKASKAYKLPARVVKPGEFVLVYCDKEGEGLHADFRVDSGKGAVYLWHDGELAETVSLSKMVAPDISWGRRSETSQTWGHQNAASPGAPNKGLCANGLLGDVVFSREGGICSSPLTLTLSLPEGAPQDAVIRYTTDGSVPTGKSAAYSKPIKITGTTVVRATVMAKGYLSPLPATASYIFHGREQTMPIVSMVGNREYFYDDKIGILAEGSYTEGKPNYMYDWRRPVNIEYFETDGSQVVNQVIETRLKGNSTRVKPLRSMVLYANKRFVTKRLSHEFFPDHKPGLTDFKSVELRNSGQDFHELYQRDALCQSLMGMNSDLDWQAYRPVVLYVNGKYMGMLNMRERANEDFVYTNYNGLEDVDVLENWGEEVKEGSETLFNEFYKFYYQEGHSLAEYEARMDIGEFMNLMIAGAVFCNVDFPANNNIMWRPTEEGGRWRWIAKDFDTCLGFNPKRHDLAYLSWLYDYNFDPAVMSGNYPSGTLLFRRLMALDEVRDMFIDRLLIYMGDFMKPEALSLQMRAHEQSIAAEHQAMKKLYDFDWEWNKSGTLMDFADGWYADRVKFMYDHAAEFFGYQGAVPTRLEVPEGMTIAINGNALRSSRFDGKWLAGRKFSASTLTPDGDNTVVAWKVTVTNKDNTETETTYPVPTLELTIPQAAAVRIDPVVGILGIDDIQGETVETAVEWYDLQGRCLGSRKPAGGIFLRKAGNKVTKVIL